MGVREKADHDSSSVVLVVHLPTISSRRLQEASSDIATNHGVLDLTFTERAYTWSFVNSLDASVVDSGSATC